MTLPTEIWAAMLGALVGAWITYRFALHLSLRHFAQLKELSQLEAWRRASEAFVQALAPELSALKSGSEVTYVADFLRDAHKARHAQAKTVFAHFLTVERRAAFEEDWLRYCYGTRDDGFPQTPDDDDSLPHEKLLFLHYTDEWKRWPTPASRAVDDLERLLNYARDA